MLRTPIAFLVFLLPHFAVPASAQNFPALSGEIEIELQVDRVYDPPAGARRRTTGFAEIEMGLGLALTEALSISSTFKIEPRREHAGSALFRSEGGVVEELFLRYAKDDFSVLGGKFSPGFGIAWDAAPGIYGSEFAEDYELTERLGGGIAYNLDAETLGKHRIGLNVFTLDTTLLSESIGSRPVFGAEGTERPGRFRRWQGGAGNTGSLDSVSVTLDGSEVQALWGLSYHLGYRHQPKGVDGVADEKGYAAALKYDFEIDWDTKLTPLVEYVELRKFGGLDRKARYITAAAVFETGPWEFSASTTLRRITAPDTERVSDWLRTIGVAYSFTDDLKLSAAWARSRQEGASTSVFGVQLRYGIEF